MHYLLNKILLLVVVVAVLSNIANATELSKPIDSQQALEQVLEQHKGEVVYLDFWASWCVPCRKSFPWMNAIVKKYQSQGFSVISVNLDRNYDLAQKFLQKMPASFPVIYDPKGKIAKHFKIAGMPSSMLIGRDGEIKSSHSGFYLNKIPQYQHDIEELLMMK